MKNWAVAILVDALLGWQNPALATDASSAPDPGLAAQAIAKKQPKVTFVRVDKSERRMWLMASDQVIRTFRISLGRQPVGQKQMEGDQKTPEGIYKIAWRNPASVAYRSMAISYPNKDDRERARAAGVSPGGNIMIHGQHNGIGWLAPIAQLLDWTNGCIAVTNSEMDEIIDLVEPGTPIAIHP
jgi:murein L,D-transpeptidase YafK